MVKDSATEVAIIEAMIFHAVLIVPCIVIAVLSSAFVAAMFGSPLEAVRDALNAIRELGTRRCHRAS